jgi:3-oxoacyl-[acyl-carrier-protein] synthase-3
MTGVTVLGTGSYVPGEAISNDDMARVFGREIVWLAELMGATSRHLAIDLRTGRTRAHESNARMAHEAARRAISDADVDPGSIDLIVMATCTPDYQFPATALFVQEMLDLPRCVVLELRAGCGGMAQAFMIACHLIRAGTARRALLIGSDLLSPYVSMLQDRDADDSELLVSVAMFGDGAGAVVLGAADVANGVLEAHSWSISTGRPAAMLLRSRPDDARSWDFRHDHRAIMELGPDMMRRACDWLKNESGCDLAAIDYVIPPQVSGNLTGMLAQELGIPGDRVVSDFPRFGNTVSASIYLALDRLRRDGTLTAGHTVVLLPAEATKWIYGAVVLRWGLEKT